ncbi:unnamed protein product [Blepharisma stoltei]|uniref:Uncharacterized protein n=1 Tax=Blepharisma stoltei TaxID=1481888 RepID=A0AAU9JCQ6_9CILI|nr:unnamed protein product [Blepharisma stoltei]
MALIKESNSFELPKLLHKSSLVSDSSTRESFDDIERRFSLDFDSENSEVKSPRLAENFPTLNIIQHCQKQGVCKPIDMAWLFQPLTSSQKSKIENLNYMVDRLLNNLEDTFEAINVRDDCSLKPKSVELSNPDCSFISKRRLTLPCHTLRV